MPSTSTYRWTSLTAAVADKGSPLREYLIGAYESGLTLGDRQKLESAIGGDPAATVQYVVLGTSVKVTKPAGGCSDQADIATYGDVQSSLERRRRTRGARPSTIWAEMIDLGFAPTWTFTGRVPWRAALASQIRIRLIDSRGVAHCIQ